MIISILIFEVSVNTFIASGFTLTAQELLKKYTSTIEQLQNTTDKDLERRLYTYLSKIFSVIKDSLKEKGEKMINIGYNPVYNNAKSPNYYE